MGVPTGKVVDAPLVARACGCVCEFRVHAGDRYREQRLAKFRETRCPACVAKLEEERRREVAARPPKGEAVAALPAGAQMALIRQSDGTWVGRLVAQETAVEAVADAPQWLPVTLAQLWAVARGAGAARSAG